MVLPIIIALTALFGGLYIFKDDISKKINPVKSEAEKERERQEAKVRDKKGAFGNTRDFLFGEQSTIPPTPEELEAKKKIEERGAFANIQAFFFGEESLKPSEQAPNLASGDRKEENIVKELKIDEKNQPIISDNNVILNNKFSGNRRTKTILSQKNKLSSIANDKVSTNPKPVASTTPESNPNNVIPKNKRVSKGKTKTEIITEKQRPSKTETLKNTQPSSNIQNIIAKNKRQKMSVFNPTKSPNSEIPVEQREDDLRIG